MSLDHHYKFLILLPQEGGRHLRQQDGGDDKYFGLLWSGEVLARGIEIRRHDTPKFINEFEVRLIQTLFDCSTPEEVRSKGYENCLRLVTEEIDRVMTGELTKEDLDGEQDSAKATQRIQLSVSTCDRRTATCIAGEIGQKWRHD